MTTENLSDMELRVIASSDYPDRLRAMAKELLERRAVAQLAAEQGPPRVQYLTGHVPPGSYTVVPTDAYNADQQSLTNAIAENARLVQQKADDDATIAVLRTQHAHQATIAITKIEELRKLLRIDDSGCSPTHVVIVASQVLAGIDMAIDPRSVPAGMSRVEAISYRRRSIAEALGVPHTMARTISWEALVTQAEIVYAERRDAGELRAQNDRLAARLAEVRKAIDS